MIKFYLKVFLYDRRGAVRRAIRFADRSCQRLTITGYAFCCIKL